jgi:MYXO-CTERM domain-containing protein
LKPQIRSTFSAAVFVFAGVTSAQVEAQTTGATGARDASRMIESDGRVYQYGTGGGARSSADGLAWKADTTPPWNTSYLPNNERIWAPDGMYLNGRYLLYGSMWASTNKSSALVLLTTPSLDPSKAQWADKGVVVSGPAGVTHSCIDPAPVLDAQGNLWLAWGGGYPFDSAADSIFVTRLDNNTGLPLTTDPGYNPPASPGYPIAKGHKEGAYLYYHGGNYYLWYQTGNCCGTNNAYLMHVARASAITGPYSGDRTFLASSSGRTGPGHIGIYSCGGVERFTYHYISSSGGTVIGENTLTWDSDGWPNANSPVTSGLTLPCQTMTPPTGGSGAGGSGAGGSGAGGSGAGGAAPETGGTGPGTAGGGPDNGGSSTGGSSDGGAGTPATGGSAPVAAAGAPASGGSSPASAGTVSTPTDSGSAGSGCSCSVPNKRGRASIDGLFVLAMVAAFGGRRRRPPHEPTRKS